MLFTNIPLGLAFLAGLASFLSPCVFSILPAYISYLGGRSLTVQEKNPRMKVDWQTFFHGTAFIVGFSLVFILLGLAFSAIGKLFNEISPILSKIGGVIVILFGLNMTGLLHIPFLSYDLRIKSKSSKIVSLLSSFLLGIVFSAGWSPCIGPTLGLILTMAMNSTSIGNGVLLLVLYSLGMG
ncbi:MAG: cytochrome c biogenesis protein CcdA, partial [Anaerolineaceae bacterium]|nr:cytochrome c biogenesis protein CcdA [Anaerolineaceae bacterium]